MAIDDLNIYTRLCEILIIYIWGYISIWVEMNRGEIKYGGWFDTVMVCPICGNKFNLNSNTQRNTCDECYKKDFLKRNSMSANRYYHNRFKKI